MANAAEVAPALALSPQFWCHVCGGGVATVIDVDSAEVCCRVCGGNFVEEIDAVSGCFLCHSHEPTTAAYAV